MTPDRQTSSSRVVRQAAEQRAIQALEAVPDDATIAEAIERLCLIARIAEGLRQSEAGQITYHERSTSAFSREDDSL